MKLNLSNIRSPLSKLDIILLIALGLIGGGVYQELGSGCAMLSVGVLTLLLGLLMARGKTQGGVE